MNYVTLQDFYLNYNEGTADNGNVSLWNANYKQVFSRSYTYDQVNRLTGMADADTVATCQGATWTYDAWGNRLTQTPTKGSCGMWNQGYDATNRITGWSYDAAGNLLNDHSHTYAYDAENRITTVDGGATASYLYDAEGRRVTTTTAAGWRNYLYDAAGSILAETIAAGWSRGYVYLHGGMIAQYDNSTTHFIHSDQLGSTRVITQMNSTTPYDSLDYMPFGEQISGDTGTSHKFTGKERDSESGLDDFGARYMSSQYGRFMSPDPLGGHYEDPQTLNRYVYVRDNPLSLTDPTGLDFYLSCQTASNTCGKDAAGDLVQGTTTTTTDANGHTSSTFNATVITSASLQYPNSGNTATVNQNGVQITTTDASGNKSTAEGIFINNTPAANVQGSGDLSGFAFNINSSNEKIGTLDAGTYTYEGSRNQADVIKTLTDRGAFSYPGENSIGNPWHPGDLNFRFSSGGHPELFDYGPSPHLLVPTDPKATVPVGPGYPGQFHVDSHTGAFSHGSCAIFHAGCQ